MELYKKHKKTPVGHTGQQTGQELTVKSCRKGQANCIWVVLVGVEADWGTGAFPSFALTTTAKTASEKSAEIKMPCCLEQGRSWERGLPACRDIPKYWATAVQLHIHPSQWTEGLADCELCIFLWVWSHPQPIIRRWNWSTFFWLLRNADTNWTEYELIKGLPLQSRANSSSHIAVHAGMEMLVSRNGVFHQVLMTAPVFVSQKTKIANASVWIWLPLPSPDCAPPPAAEFSVLELLPSLFKPTMSWKWLPVIYPELGTSPWLGGEEEFGQQSKWIELK